MDYTSTNLQETENLAKKFLADNADTNLVGLVGDLGSGKTAFANGIAKALEIDTNITSPTFVIMKNYGGPKKNLVHIDAYRLSSADDLEALGFYELVSDENNLIVIEWPEKVFKKYPKEMKIVKFEYTDENTREIIF